MASLTQPPYLSKNYLSEMTTKDYPYTYYFPVGLLNKDIPHSARDSSPPKMRAEHEPYGHLRKRVHILADISFVDPTQDVMDRPQSAMLSSPAQPRTPKKQQQHNRQWARREKRLQQRIINASPKCTGSCIGYSERRRMEKPKMQSMAGYHVAE